MTPRADCPVVSFVIPVRNDAARLRRCLDSIARNHYPADCVEVIVVDNGSRDRSADVARQCGARVLLISDAAVADLRNRGAAAARAGILAFVDADHEIDPHWIRHAVATLAGDDVAAAGAPYVSPDGATWVQRRYDGLRTRPSEPADVEWLGSGNLVLRRAVFDEVGGFDTSLETCEDVDLCQRIRDRGHRIVAVRERAQDQRGRMGVVLPEPAARVGNVASIRADNAGTRAANPGCCGRLPSAAPSTLPAG